MNDKVGKLTTGLDETQQQALGDLDELAKLLTTYETPPEPNAEDHARLLATLEPYMPAQPPGEAAANQDLRAWMALAWSQAKLVQAPFWWAGGLVLLLGLVTALLDKGDLLTLMWIFLAPVLSVAGVAYAFRPETSTLRELERLTPVNPLVLLYARLLLVLAFDAAVSLILLVVVWLQVPQLVLWRLLLAWLGPMLALTGVALYATVRWSPTHGMVLPLGLWGTFVLAGWWQVVERADGMRDAAAWLLTQINASSAISIACVVAMALGLLLLWQSGQWATETT